MIKIQEIICLNKDLIADLLAIWRRSVKTSHTFLSDDEISRVEKYVPEAISSVSHLLVAYENEKAVGFLGVIEQKIEMLFIDDKEQDKGIGSSLVNQAIKRYGVEKVVVNEENHKAHAFYLKLGFKDIERKETDEQGGPYPIIIMKR